MKIQYLEDYRVDSQTLQMVPVNCNRPEFKDRNGGVMVL